MCRMAARALLGLSLAAIVFGRRTLALRLNEDLVEEDLHYRQDDLKAQLISAAPRGGLAKKCDPFPGKRVVVVTVNEEYLDMFENWLGHAKSFLQATEHLHVVAEEESAVEPLKKMQQESDVKFSLATPSDEAAGTSLLQAPYNSKDYGKLVWKRPGRILEFLRKGCSVLYTDIDTVWLKDPFRDIDAVGSGDTYLTDDDATHLGGNMCTCFMFFHPTDSAIGLLEDWDANASGDRNQVVFNKVLKKALKGPARQRPMLLSLPVASFPPGKWANDNPNPSVYHANWISGIKNKVGFFQDRNLWSQKPL